VPANYRILVMLTKAEYESVLRMRHVLTEYVSHSSTDKTLFLMKLNVWVYYNPSVRQTQGRTPGVNTTGRGLRTDGIAASMCQPTQRSLQRILWKSRRLWGVHDCYAGLKAGRSIIVSSIATKIKVRSQRRKYYLQD
jgi:hypothetical protein